MPPPRRVVDPYDKHGRQKMRTKGKLKVFLEFVGGHPHHTEYEFSDAVQLHTRIRGESSAHGRRCRVGSPAHVEPCAQSEEVHNDSNASALVKVGETLRGESPKYQPQRKYPKYQPLPVCRYRLGSFLSRPSSDGGGGTGLGETHPHCFAATVHTRPGLSYWRYTYATAATGPEAEKAKLAACALAISDWFAQGANPLPKPAKGLLAYSFALRSHHRGQQFKLLQEQEVRSSAEADRTLTESERPKLPKGAVMEAIAVSEEFDASIRRPVRHILVGVGNMEAKHVHTLLMQCGLTVHADAFFDAGVNGATLLQLKDAEHQGELDKWCEKASKGGGGEKRLGGASPRSRGLSQGGVEGLSCDMKTRRTILRAVEEIESGTGKLSGWITVPVARNAWGGSGGGDDSDSDYGDEDIDDYLEAVLGSPGGMMAVASSPRVSASGTPAIYAPPYNVVGESSLQLGEAAASNAGRHTINRTVLGRRKELDQGYSYTDVTLRTAFPLEVLESYADSQSALWKAPGFKWDALTAQSHVEAIGQAIAESAQEAAKRSVGVGATTGLYRSPNTNTVISMLLQAERGDVRASPVIARLEDNLKLESVEGLYKRVAQSETIPDEAVVAAERSGKGKKGGVPGKLRQLLLDAADSRGSSERLLEKLIGHAEAMQRAGMANDKMQAELGDAVELGSPTEVAGKAAGVKAPASGGGLTIELDEDEGTGGGELPHTPVARKKSVVPSGLGVSLDAGQKKKKKKKKKRVVRTYKPRRPTATVPFALGSRSVEHEALTSASRGEQEAEMQLQGNSMAPSRQMQRQSKGHAGRWSWEWRESGEGKRAIAAQRKALNDRYSKGSSKTTVGAPMASPTAAGDFVLQRANIGPDAAAKLWEAGFTTAEKLAGLTDGDLKALRLDRRDRTAIKKAQDAADDTRSVVVDVGASENNRKVVLVRGLLAAESVPIVPADASGALAGARFEVYVKPLGSKPTAIAKQAKAAEGEPEPEPEPEPVSGGQDLFRPLIETLNQGGVRGIQELEVIRVDERANDGWSWDLRLRCTIARHSTAVSGARSSASSPLRAPAGHWEGVHVDATAPDPEKYKEIAKQELREAEAARLDATVAKAEGAAAEEAAALWFQGQAERKANAALLASAIKKGQRADNSVVPSLRASVPSPSYWEWKQSPAGKRAIRQQSKSVDHLYSHDRKGVAKSVDELELELRRTVRIEEEQAALSKSVDESGRDMTAKEMVDDLDARVLARRSIHVQL